MKNPGCGKQPGFSSVHLREIILPNPQFPKPPAAMMLKARTACGDDADPLSHRLVFKFLRF